jgi:hypothetical protein
VGFPWVNVQQPFPDLLLFTHVTKEEACWSGLLDELQPEIIASKELSLWKIGHTEFSLQIELSAYHTKENRFSLNPYYFLNATRYN